MVKMLIGAQQPPLATAEPVAPPRQPAPQRAEWMDQASFRAVCQEHVPGLLGCVTRMTFGDRQAAEDVVQETLLRAWQHPETLPPERSSLRPWLFAVARNLVVDRQRSRSPRPTEVSEALAATPTRIDDLDAALTSWTVQRALARLSPDHRTVLVDVYYRGRGVAETADKLGVPAGTVKSRTYYALRALRLAMQEVGVLPADPAAA